MTQALSDDALVQMWLAGRVATTASAYRRVIRGLRASIVQSGPLLGATLPDLQAHLKSIEHMALRSQALHLAAIRSFYAFQTKLGLLDRNPALALAEIKVASDLADRILRTDEVERLIAAAAPHRRFLLRLIYVSGIRVSEAADLRWGQVKSRADGSGLGQISVRGKGGKTRAILLPAQAFKALVDLYVNPQPTRPVFPAEHDAWRTIDPRQITRIIKAAAKAAGLSPRISAHWLRHAHVSHALDAGAPVQLVRDSVGHASIATTDKYAHAKPGDGSARFITREPS